MTVSGILWIVAAETGHPLLPDGILVHLYTRVDDNCET